MKAVILDGYTTNPGDLSWDWLGALCDYEVYDRTPKELTLERCKGCEIVITNKTLLPRDILENLPELKYIGLLSTGYNVVDIDYCADKNIPVCNIPSYSTGAVAQLTFAFILEHCSRVALHSQAVMNGEWSACKDFCFQKAPLTELEGKTLGIIGYGKIGKTVARIAEAFGMNVCVYTSHPAGEGVSFVSLDELITQSDFITVHTPLTPATENLVNSEFLSKMKKTAFLVNTSRGPVIDEKALADALNNGQIAGAGLDVLRSEPPEANNPLFNCKNCYITPHIAWAGFETRERLMSVFKSNLEAFLAGKPQNVVWKR
ncbi:MAG: D-2-hydroxyacid dehydrogenase [Clostridia bacterium]|nr:D-2-hydroxyacid dehydrogenase [Clostridia bacterium]